MIERLRLLWKRYTPLEERLLAETRSALPEAARATFDAQLAAVNRVQRLPPSWSEVSFYRMRHGKVDWSDVPPFPCSDELRVAEVRFEAGGKPYRAVLLSVAGHIFQLTIVPPAKPVAFAEWDTAAKVTLLGDPMRPSTGESATEAMPEAWATFLASGRPAAGWTLHDGATAYRVTLEDGEYLVLAEREGEEFLLHRVEPPGEQLFLHELHQGAPRVIEGDLREVLGEGRNVSTTLRQFAFAFSEEPPSRRERRDRRKARNC